jgi:hypothetical protein
MRKRIDYRHWLKHLLICDSVLPLIALLLPFVLQVFFKAQDKFLSLVIVFAAIALAVVRARLGFRVISNNACTESVRRIQKAGLIVGVVWMLLADTLFMTIGTVAVGLPVRSLTEMIVVAFGVYLLLMAVATYPGRTLDADSANHDNITNPWMR